MSKKIIAIVLAFLQVVGYICVCAEEFAQKSESVASEIYIATQDTYTDEAKPLKVSGFENELLLDNTEGNMKKIHLTFRIQDEIKENDRIFLRMKLSDIISEENSEKCLISIYEASEQEWLQSRLNWENSHKEKTKIAEVEAEVGKEFMADVSKSVKSARNTKGYISFIIKTGETGLKCLLPSVESLDDAVPALVLYKNVIKQENTGASVNKENEKLIFKKITKKYPHYPQPPVLPVDFDIDEYTTTRYKPWMLLYHMTSTKQLELGYHGGEAGQMMWTMAISPTNPDRMLIGSDTEGIWGSENGGVSWVPSNNGMLAQGTSALAFDPEDGNVVYVRGYTGNHNITDVSAIYKSTDAGFSWRKICAYESNRYTNVRGFAFGNRDKTGNRRIYLIGNNGQGLFVSDDEGENWHFTGGLEGVDTNDILVVGNKVFITTGTGVIVSEDSGETWTDTSNGLPVDNDGNKLAVEGITSHPTNSQHMVCSVDNCLYTSMDGGETWEFTCDSSQYSNAQPLKIEFSAPLTDGSAILYAYIHGKQRSLRTSYDNGKTFIAASHHNDQQFLVDNWGIGAEAWAVHPTDPYTCFVSLDGEPQVTHDGGKNIYPTSSGYSGFRGTQIDFKPDGSEYYMSYIDRGFAHSVFTGREEKYPAMDLFPSEDRFWIREYGSKTTTGIAANWNKPGEVWANVGNWAVGKLKKSTDGGRTFVNVVDNVPAGKIFVHPQKPDIIYASDKITYDGGETWITVPYLIRAMSPVNGDIIYAREETCSYWSKDAGRTWSQLTSAPIKYTQQFTCDLADEDKVYIGSFAGLTIVDGNEIVATHSSIENSTLGKTKDGKEKGVFQYYGIAQDPNNLSHLVTAANDQSRFTIGGGVWESFDGGLTWNYVEGLGGTADVWGLQFHPTESRCYMFTSNGTWVYECDNYYDMSKNVYRDVTDGYYAKDKIEKLYYDGILYQYHDGYFRPEEGMKRGQFVGMIRKALNLTQKRYENTFVDIDRRNIYYVDIQAAFENGIILPADDGYFRPEEEILYDDVVIMLYNAMKKMHIQDKSEISQMYNYVDENVPLKIRYAVYQLKLHGVIDNTVEIEAGKTATNTDIAVMFSNFLNIVK